MTWPRSSWTMRCRRSKAPASNVVGRLKGRSDEQQIIVSGHYDVYFNGFQDDSCAVGLVLAMAKGMVDSGYQPENDILFIAHGAEEWALPARSLTGRPAPGR